MTEITELELQKIREEQITYQPEIGDLTRPSMHDEIDPGAALIAHDIQCRITAGVGAFRQVADRLQSVNPFTLTFPAGTDAQADDRFLDAGGHEFHIKAVRHPSSYETAVQCFAELIH